MGAYGRAFMFRFGWTMAGSAVVVVAFIVGALALDRAELLATQRFWLLCAAFLAVGTLLGVFNAVQSAAHSAKRQGLPARGDDVVALYTESVWPQPNPRTSFLRMQVDVFPDRVVVSTPQDGLWPNRTKIQPVTIALRNVAHVGRVHDRVIGPASVMPGIFATKRPRFRGLRLTLRDGHQRFVPTENVDGLAAILESTMRA